MAAQKQAEGGDMTDFNINVIVDPRNANKGMDAIDRRLVKTENQAERTGRILKRALAFGAGALGIRELGRYADTFTNIQNRIRTVTDSTAELNTVTEQLFNISQRTRSSFKGTTELYARTALAVRELGISQKQTLEFTESLNQAVVLSGANAIEAEAGIIQLAQGLASGAVQGEELRSVLEQIPVVADVIAKEMKVTRGELRKLGSEGKITADIVLNAFKNAREELAERFGGTIPTLSQSFQVLQNSIIRTVGQIDSALGVSSNLSRVVISLAENVDILARGLLTAAGVLAVQFARQGVGAAIAAVKTLTLAIAANPLGALAVAATTTAAALVAFSDQIKVSGDGLITLADYGLATFTVLYEYASRFTDFFGDAFNDASELANESISDIGLTFDDILSVGRTFVNRYIGLYVGVGAAIRSIFTDVRRIVSEALGADTLNAIGTNIGRFIDYVGGVADLAVEKFNELRGVAKQAAQETAQVFEGLDIQSPVLDAFGEVGSNAAKAFTENFNRDFVSEALTGLAPIGDAIGEQAAKNAADRRARDSSVGDIDLTGVTTPTITQGAAEFSRYTEELDKQNRAIGLAINDREVYMGVLKAEKDLKRELTAAEYDYVEQLLRERQAIEQLPDILASLRTPEENAIATLNEQFSEQQSIVQSAMDARILTAEEGYSTLEELAKKHSNQIRDIEYSRLQGQLSAGEETFGSLAKIAKTYGGEQSKTYKRLFKVQKAFDIASATMSIASGIAKAANNPWPLNLGAIASTVASTANLVSTIQGAQYAGEFQNGGEFKVGGSGGTDSQMVSFRATPGESVRVSTPQQDFSANQNQGGQGGGAVQLNVAFFGDEMKGVEWLNTQEGQGFLINIMDRNKTEINATLNS